MSELVAAVERLIRAFPNEDPDGHRLAHEEMIATIRARREFWQKLVFEITKYGLLGALGWAAIALWGAFLKGPK